MMGRDTNYANLERRGHTALTRQQTATDYQPHDNGRNAQSRPEYLPDGECRVGCPRADYKTVTSVPYNYDHNIGVMDPSGHDYSGVNVYRKTNMFDDCNTFSREVSSAILGRPELEKFERNPYRSRYLNTPECEMLLKKNCQRLLHTYYNRAETLCSNVASDGMTRVTFEDISESGLTSTDHLTGLVTMAILARYHKIGFLLPHTVDSVGSNAHVAMHVLNVIRAIYSAAYSYGVSQLIQWNSVDIAKRFYALLRRGVWQTVAQEDDGFSSLDRRVAQRISLLYALCLHLLEAILSNTPEFVEEVLDCNEDLYGTMVCVACCFVEQDVRNNERGGYIPSEGDMPEDRMAPDIEDRNAIFSKHWSVLNGLLSCGVKFDNTDLLVKGVKALCNMLESKNTGRSLLLWAYCVYIRLCPTEISQNNYSIPRILFEYMSKCRSVLQLKAVIDALGVCMKDVGFVRYADDRMNPQKTFATFVLHSCNLIHNKMDDLAVPILQMLHLLFDLCPKTLPYIANTMSGTAGLLERYSETVGNAVETFLNVAILSVGHIQVIMSLIMRRVLLRSDVSKSLNSELRAKFVRHLLTMVGFKKPARDSPVDPTALVSKIALLDAFIQAGGLPELVAAMKEVNAKQLRLIALNRSTASPEFLHKALCIGDIATKLVAYDVLGGYRSDTMDSGTFLLCALCSAVNMCPSVGTLLRDYSYAYSSISEYHGSGTFVSEGKFLRALSSDSSLGDPNRSNKTAALLSLHAILSSIHMSSETFKQGLIHSLLCPDESGSREHQVLVAKYKAQIASHRKELAKSNARLDAQAKEFQQHRASTAKQLELINEEWSGKVERSRAELEDTKNQLSSATSQAHQLDRECTKLRSQVRELDQAIRQVTTERTHISDSLREANMNRDRLMSENSSLQAQIEQRDASIAQLRNVESDNAHLNQEVSELNAQVERVYRMLISLMYKHKQIEVDLVLSHEEQEKTAQQLRERQLKVDDLSNMCRNHESTISSMRAAKDAVDSEVQRLTRDIQSLEVRLHTTNEEMSMLQARYTQTTQSLKDYEEQNLRLSEQLQHCESQLRQRGEHLSTIYSTFQDKHY